MTKSFQKDIKILNQKTSVHPHLPPNHIRITEPLFGRDSGPLLDFNTFLTNISRAEFVISPAGDRDDCFRHYECIGLGAVPVSNIDHQEIFGSNMICSNAEEMRRMVLENKVDYAYTAPDRDLLTTRYWVDKLKKRCIDLGI
jgi:hypothetical protein